MSAADGRISGQAGTTEPIRRGEETSARIRREADLNPAPPSPLNPPAVIDAMSCSGSASAELLRRQPGATSAGRLMLPPARPGERGRVLGDLGLEQCRNR
ncbi:hypothetical protein [Nonomuraea glycinis]|uniref:hypothetical protein n=1 Tax=Nonomuraea glycinis TaxID=2047744 RepID=UPI002E0DED04|nr:hypothetical protein OHA68_36005 [Nonomuraea glycinis]